MVMYSSAPRSSGEIKGGSSEITGGFDIDSAEDLANILKSGKLPAPAKVIQDTVVGPSLGKEAIQCRSTSFLIAFVLVLDIYDSVVQQAVQDWLQILHLL